MITPEQQTQIDTYLKSTNYTPPTSNDSSDWFAQTAPKQTSKLAEKPTDYLQKAGDIVNTIFPGKQIGEVIGTDVGALGTKLKDFLTGSKESAGYSMEQPSPYQVIGDAAQAGLTIAAPAIGSGETAIGRIAANTALGAGIGGTEAIAQGKGIGDIAKSTAIGGGIGLGASSLAEGIGKLVQNLPKWFTQKALPKLSSGNVDYALENTKIGSINTLTENSDAAVKSYGNQIQSILEHPQYANETGDGAASLQGVLQSFPNANLDTEKITGIVRKVVPGSEKLVDKLSEGTAILLEKNQLRQQLDLATKKVFTDSPDITFSKQVAHALADTLRNEVKSVAPETEPIFEQFSKEMNLNKALSAVQNRLQKGAAVNALDIISALGGSGIGAVTGGVAGGVPGAALGVGAERIIRSPAVQLGTAKAIQGLGKTAPVVSAVGKAIKAPAIKMITGQ